MEQTRENVQSSRRTLRRLLVASVLMGAGFLYMRRLRGNLPCPSSLSWMLENPYVNGLIGADLLLERAGVSAGMSVLDVGCGPGRITLPAAQRVGAAGRVTGLDVQPAMFERLRAKLAANYQPNVHLLLAGAGEGQTEPGRYDRALLVTVLGEIPDKPAALTEIYRALKPGGILSVTELFPDPDMLTQASVRTLGLAAGFEVASVLGGFPAYTMNLRKAISSDQTPAA